MSLRENTEKDAEDFPCCGDSTADQWIKRGNSIENERLTDSRTHRELDDSIGRSRERKNRGKRMRGSISVNFHWILSMKIKIQVMHRDQ